jgi:hypothetical protein
MQSKRSLRGPAPIRLVKLTGNRLLLMIAATEGVVALPRELLVLLPAAVLLLVVLTSWLPLLDTL